VRRSVYFYRFQCTCFFLLCRKCQLLFFRRYQWTHFTWLLSMSFSTKKKEYTSLLFLFVICRMTNSNKNNCHERRRKKKKKKMATIRLFLDFLVLSKYECIWYWHTHTKDILPSIACRARSDTSGAKPTLLHSNVNAIFA
jgi:uncharacterized membrane protein